MKRFTAIILTTALVATLAVPVFAATTADALAILRHVAGGDPLSAEQRSALNIGADEEITTNHALAILKSIAGGGDIGEPEPPMVTAPAPLEPLTDEVDLAIRESYVEFLGGELHGREITAEDLEILHYFGTYNDYQIVVVYPKGGIATADMQFIHLGGHEIALGSGSFRLMAHKDGEFTPIQDAYEAGYITDENVRFIAFYNLNP
ncbi:MAG: hypothetical protein FWH20_02565 [Oscillospiraceae bacterium]|nr:hypothetical protein [Oscillospiraceae bacterium]